MDQQACTYTSPLRHLTQAQLNRLSVTVMMVDGYGWYVLVHGMWLVIHHRGNVGCYGHGKHTRRSEAKRAKMTTKGRRKGRSQSERTRESQRR